MQNFNQTFSDRFNCCRYSSGRLIVFVLETAMQGNAGTSFPAKALNEEGPELL
jgi:hypothetical protein